MKNLWTISGRARKADSIHMPRLLSGRFAPISNSSQAVVALRDFGVIPLRASSY
jgi:hypothetical protein